MKPTAGLPTQLGKEANNSAGMLAKVMKLATARGEENNNIAPVNMRWGQQQQRRSEQHSAGTPATAAEIHN
jgi:hypothetical protein